MGTSYDCLSARGEETDDSIIALMAEDVTKLLPRAHCLVRVGDLKLSDLSSCEARPAAIV